MRPGTSGSKVLASVTPGGSVVISLEDLGDVKPQRSNPKANGARLQCLGDAKNALRMNLPTTSVLDIFTYSLPVGFSVNFISADGSSSSKPLSIDQHKWGIQVVWMGADFYTEQFEPSMLDMSTADYLDRLKPDGTVEAGPYINDNLPRLVYFQFLVAASALHTDRELSLELLNWVCNLSASPTTVSLNIEACSFRNSLVLSNNYDIFNVPSVNIMLLSRTHFRASLPKDALAPNLLVYNVIDECQFLEELAQNGYDAAVTANKVAQKRFLDTENSIKNFQQRFQESVEGWGKKKEKEAVVYTFKAVMSVVGAVAATVATGGFAAPSISLALKSGVGTVKALSHVLNELKRLHNRVKPVIESLMKLTTAVAGVVAALQAAQKVRDDSAVQRPDMSLDLFNATALWTFSCEHFFALRKLVIMGKTYLQTQENLCRRGNDLAIVLVKLKWQRRDQARLTVSSTELSQQDAVLDILRRAMFNRLLMIRSLIFLDFQTYSEAYMFHALTTCPPISVLPIQPVAKFLDAAAKLQGSVAAFGSRVQIQNRRFTIYTLGNAADAMELRTRLHAGESITVSLHPDQPIFQGFSRIRVVRVRCYLDGAKTIRPPAEIETLRLYLKTSGRFSDIALPGARRDRVYNFVGEVRTLLFEYDVGDWTIVCDGEYSQQRDCTLQTPLTEWEVTIAPGGLEMKDLDLEGLTGLRMEFWCDITLSES
ncbi:hypothetical protein QBC36DRAFT_349786 [Triangularia setosa]|uniref:Uncharacterized protein n=1 Tax=Triangularia setosa TaxID=2587417 RepID=A0AAN6VYJ4_9PEZI|nr:hypothetical protein QBC36DRAFT_349786 [Podospora setosa]